MSGLPTSASYICTFISGLVCLRFIAKYGTPTELAGASLAFTWSGVFCVAILYSINQGFSVLAAQLVGAKKYYEVGLLLQRNLFAIGIIVIPLLISFCLADIILIRLGLNYEVSINAGIYLRTVIPSVVALGVFECLKAYLIAQNYFYIQPIIQGGFAFIHVFWCYLFVDRLNMPVAGIAIAKSITDVSSAGILWLYIKFSGKFKESWIPWNSCCLNQWWLHLKRTLTIGSNLYVEWISIEVSLFIVGILNDEYILGAHGIVISIISVFFMLPLGNSVSMQAYIGNAVGEGLESKAKKFMFVGLALNLVITLINVFVMIFFCDELADFFTNDEKTKQIFKRMVYIYSAGHIPDTNINHLTGVLRNVGKEREVLKSFCILYTLIAVNCEWIFGVALGYGYVAVWVSMIIGMYLMFGWAIWKVGTLNWSKEINIIHKQVTNSQNQVSLISIEMNEK